MDYSSGNISVYLGNNGESDSFLGGFNSNGTYTVHHRLTNSVANYLIFRNGTSGSNYSIDNVSVKEVGQNWSLQNGWSIENNKAKFVRDTSDSNIVQANVFTIGSKYRVIIDVDYINNNGGTGRAMLRNPDNTTIQPFLSVGLNEYEIVAQGTNLTVRGERADFEISLNSITVKEITDDTDIPRIDYTGGVGSILLEPESTNLVTYSEDFTQWTLGSNSTLALDNSVTAPDGSTGVYRLTLPATSGTFINSNTFSSITGTLSIYVKSAGTVNNDFNLYGGFGAASPLKTATSEWQRFTFENILCSGFYIVNSGDTFISDIYIWGAQLEQQSFPTSYIPTVGSTVTRLGETCNNSGNADLFNDSEGVLYAEIGALADDLTERSISLASGDGNNRVTLQYKNVSNQVQAIYRLSSSNTGNVSFTLTDSTQFNKIAFKYKENDFALWVNGVEVATDNSGSTGSIGITALSFDRLNTNNTRFFGKTKCVAVFKEALSNDELECLTGEGYESFSALAQAFNYTII